MKIGFVVTLTTTMILTILLFLCRLQKDKLQDELDELTPVEPEGVLVIENSDAGEWIDFSNAFTLDPDVSADVCDATKPVYRPAVLFQLGQYMADSNYDYDHIDIYSSGSKKPDTYSDWVWVDIIAESDSRDPPIDPDDAFLLYPNSGHPSESCDEDTDDICLRNRLISCFLNDVQAIMTYWQGPSGYGIDAAQGDNVCAGNTFRFSFPDPFRVNVYRPSNPDTDTSMGTPVSYAVGDVDSIVVVVDKVTGPDLGQTQPPPWPYP